MVNMINPILNAAHAHSMNNKAVIEAGGQCGCFHCLHTFDTKKVTAYGGSGGTTALCPICHYDTVLSAELDPIDHEFLQRMHGAWFNENDAIPLDLHASEPTTSK